MDFFLKLYLFFVISIDGFRGSCQYWSNEIYKRDLDERVCCDGKMCGCGGVTIREQWTHHKDTN